SPTTRRHGHRQPHHVPPTPVGAGFHPRPDAGMTADPVSPHQPCRGRRPRRPFPSFITGTTAARRGCGRLRPPAKGEPPARVPPLTPSCASLAMGYSARCGARPRAPPLDPARFFVKKRGKKLLNASLHPTQAPRPWGE